LFEDFHYDDLNAPMKHMNIKHPSFKRPYWRALFASLSVFLSSSYACWAMAVYIAHKGNDSSPWLRSTGGPIAWGLFWLAMVGAFGVVASLIWWFCRPLLSGSARTI
jgi:hypothetical protein